LDLRIDAIIKSCETATKSHKCIGFFRRAVRCNAANLESLFLGSLLTAISCATTRFNNTNKRFASLNSKQPEDGKIKNSLDVPWLLFVFPLMCHDCSLRNVSLVSWQAIRELQFHLSDLYLLRHGRLYEHERNPSTSPRFYD
jgi:hypothetical protein